LTLTPNSWTTGQTIHYFTTVYLVWKTQDLQKQEAVSAIPGKRTGHKLYPKTEAAFK